jgi:flagellar biosynthesis protein FlhF
MDGLKVAVITTDTVRAGGIEQLSAFTKLLQIDLKKARNAQALREILDELRGRYDQIYIDTQGVNPFSREDMKQAAVLLGAADMESILVMPGGLDAEESGEIARAFAAMQVHHLMPTRVDMARRLGGILSAATHGSMSFTDAGNTPKVADGLFNLTPQSLSRLLMPSSYRGESNTSAGTSSGNPRPRTAPSTTQEKRKSIKQ